MRSCVLIKQTLSRPSGEQDAATEPQQGEAGGKALTAPWGEGEGRGLVGRQGPGC